MPENLPVRGDTLSGMPLADAGTTNPITIPATDRITAAGLTPEAAPPGYEILAELGRGGMGVVYQARHTALARTVALKMILAGVHATPAERHRFLQEAGAAAQLRHPNIVQVYEVGEHTGLPYFTLEYIDGGSLAARARDPLPPREAAAIVEQVARGVAHAHAAGIIHRDLKPENVLLASGPRERAGSGSGGDRPALPEPVARLTPKITDFGLAKRVGGGDGLTATGAILGTPSYMAPEQAAGDAKYVGPAADVYALGAVLYRLLTGRPPFAAPTPHETIYQVMAVDPPNPSILVPKLPRDVETICLKCLRKDPRQRYATADAVADDLGRFLAGEAIVARPVGSAERAWKWTKRNRGPAASGAAVFLALAAGAGVATWQAVEADGARGAAESAATQANAARTEAERQRETATAVKDFLKEILIQATAQNQAAPDRKVDPHLTVKEAMDYAAKQIGARFADRPLVAAELHATVGDRYLELGAFAEAAAQTERALKLREQELGPDHPDAIKSLNDLGQIYEELGKFADAERMLTRAAERGERVLGPAHKTTLTSLSNLASLYYSRGEFARAEPVFEKVLAGTEKANGPDHPDTLQDLINLGHLSEKLGKLDRAEALLSRAAAACLKVHGPEHPDTLAARNNLALVYLARGDYDRAGPLFAAVAAAAEKVLGPDHPNTLSSVGNVAKVAEARGRFAEAEPLLRRVLAALEKREPGAWTTAYAAGRLGAALLEQKKSAEAGPFLRSGFDGMKAKEGDIPPALRAARLREAAAQLARLADATGNPADAAKWRAEAAKYRETAPAPRAAGD